MREGVGGGVEGDAGEEGSEGGRGVGKVMNVRWLGGLRGPRMREGARVRGVECGGGRRLGFGGVGGGGGG